MKSAICCNECFKNIAQKDTRAARLWLDLCAYFVKLEGVFKLKETKIPWTISHFRNLEKLGFISTSDGPDAVNVRVNGYGIIEIDDEEMCLDTFCIDREEHSKLWV